MGYLRVERLIPNVLPCAGCAGRGRHGSRSHKLFSAKRTEHDIPRCLSEHPGQRVSGVDSATWHLFRQRKLNLVLPAALPEEGWQEAGWGSTSWHSAGADRRAGRREAPEGDVVGKKNRLLKETGVNSANSKQDRKIQGLSSPRGASKLERGCKALVALVWIFLA